MNEQMNYRDGVLSVRFDYMLDSMSSADKLDLIERLACEDEVVKHVADQIVLGGTDNGFSASRVCGPGPQAYLPLDAAIREVAKNSSEVARKEIEALERSLARAEKRYQDLLEEVHSPLTSR